MNRLERRLTVRETPKPNCRLQEAHSSRKKKRNQDGDVNPPVPLLFTGSAGVLDGRKWSDGLCAEQGHPAPCRSKYSTGVACSPERRDSPTAARTVRKVTFTLRPSLQHLTLNPVIARRLTTAPCQARRSGRPGRARVSNRSTGPPTTLRKSWSLAPNAWQSANEQGACAPTFDWIANPIVP